MPLSILYCVPVGLGVPTQLRRTGGNPFTQQDGPSCTCRWRGIRCNSNTRSSGTCLAMTHSSFGSDNWGVCWISELRRAPQAATWQRQPCTQYLPVPVYSSLDLLNCTSLQVTSWSTSTKPRKAGDRVQAGSARNGWLCVQRRLPQHGGEVARVCPLEPQEAPGCCRGLSTSSTHQHCSSLDPAQASQGSPGTFSRATSSGFSPSRITILASPKAVPEQRRVGEFAPISHDGGTERLPLNSSLFLYCPREAQELSHYYATCLCPGLLCHLQRRGPEQHFQLQSHSPMAGDRGFGQRGSSALPSW